MKTPLNLTLPKAVLFDLDGTLVDSAPDLAAAINQVKADRGLPPTPYDALRRMASAGAPGLIRTAFGIETSHADYPELAAAFIACYARAIAVKSTLFDGIPELLDLLRHRNILWGVVTNKRHNLTVPLLKEIGLMDAACIVSGDTTPHPKPHPEPVFEAARQAGVKPEDCWFIGDDLRDVQSGRAAGSVTIAVNWGYGTDTASWNATLIVDTPWNLSDLIRQK
ncbi:HAD-IA family hydrolase [Oxalobacter sp. OttesenSCG-928-P03]|nr:HAD-IA family hydrolase [Oxalobacter sp. OttesenSCG-928-P03]